MLEFGQRIAYRRICGAVLAWQKDGVVYAGRMPDYLPPVRGESGLEELRSEESDEDPRDFGDRCFPVAPEHRAAWLAGHRERLNAQIEKAQGDLARAEERAAETRRALRLLRADLAALEGGGA